jgi:hypothetical protein
MNVQEHFTETEQRLRAATSENARLNKIRLCVYNEGNKLKTEYEAFARIDGKLYCGRAESAGKTLDEIVNCFHNTDEPSGVIQLKDTVYALFQTDVWKSRRSRVFFGVFSDKVKAIDAAKGLGLYTDQSEVEIIECEVDKPEEL